MKVVGFRAEADKIRWAAVTGSPSDLKLGDCDQYVLPKGTTFGECLVLLRTHLLSLLKCQKPNRVSVRIAETYTGGRPPRYLGSQFARARIEGVVMEAAASLDIQVVEENLKAIGDGLKGNRKASEYLKADELKGVIYPTKNANHREAIAAAISALQE